MRKDRHSQGGTDVKKVNSEKRKRRQKLQLFRCQRVPHRRGSIRKRQIFDGRVGHKENAVFSKPGDGVYKTSKGMQGALGFRMNDENSTVKRNARKIAHNSAVEIEAAKGREMNTSKLGKQRHIPHRH